MGWADGWYKTKKSTIWVQVLTLEKCLHDELCIADPREGGGEFNMTTMMSENIVDLIENFCDIAKSATSGVPEEKMLHLEGTVTEELLHDMKVAAVMVSRVLKCICNAMFCMLSSPKSILF